MHLPEKSYPDNEIEFNTIKKFTNTYFQAILVVVRVFIKNINNLNTKSKSIATFKLYDLNC